MFSFRRFNKLSYPRRNISIGDDVTIQIQSLASSGAGVGYFIEEEKKIPIFVRYSAPGDTVKVKLMKKEKIYYTGDLLELIEASPTRITPSCKHFGICGACDWLHISYPEQLKQKENILKFITKRSNLNIESFSVVPTKQELHYKCKVRFPGDGFSMRNSNTIVKIDECKILHENFSEILPNKHKKNECWGLDEVADKVTQRDARYVVDNNVTIQYSPYSFVQSNFPMNRELVSIVVEKISTLMAVARKNEPENYDTLNKEHGKKFNAKNTVLELFSGNGNFTLSLLKRSLNVIAVEGEKSLCELMEKNAANNRNTNKEEWKDRGHLLVMNKDVLAYLKAPLIPNYSCILLDPPRTGLGRCSKYLLPSLSKFIVYVSCDAESLSQDLKAIVRNGFSIKEQILLDMFPQTSHFETVTILESTDNYELNRS